MITNANQIKKRYRELLADGNVHSRRELLDYAKSSDPDRNYTEGMLAGALKTLVDSEACYQCVDRALYQRVGIDNSKSQIEELIQRYILTLKNTLKSIDKVEVDPFLFIEMNQIESNKMQEIKECIQSIKNTVSVLEE